jgi:hypothetical protein
MEPVCQERLWNSMPTDPVYGQAKVEFPIFKFVKVFIESPDCKGVFSSNKACY